jgi:hypothetical protein
VIDSFIVEAIRTVGAIRAICAPRTGTIAAIGAIAIAAIGGAITSGGRWRSLSLGPRRFDAPSFG